jgi:Glycine cleavage system H protein (lipoate-binding)
MTVLFVITTFALILLVDHLVHRNATLTVAAPKTALPEFPRALPSMVAGFKLLDNLRYHPGHTWALTESPELVRVGVDDFAAKVAGHVDKITLPLRGHWVRQGQKAFTVERHGKQVALVSPIEGTIVDVNEEVLRNPELARKDPYGEGWLIKVSAPDLKTNLRNLLGGLVARRWMEESAARLRALVPVPVGAVAQDGGVVIDDVASQLPDVEWEQMTREFFLN